MSKFTKGQAVRFVGTENGEQFAHEGIVVSATESVVEFQTEKDGIMNVQTSENVTVIEKPSKRVKAISTNVETKESTKSVKAPKSIKVEKPAKAEKATRVGSKQETVNEMFKSMTGASRKDVIAAIVAAGITTAAGASTMFANAKRLAK
jgi:type IV secretory pathway VirB2 component (pilin)